MFMFLKHLGCLAFPITKGFSFPPVLLLASITVIRSFASFPPLHASPLGASVLSGNALKNKPVSSTLKISSALIGNHPLHCHLRLHFHHKL